MRDEIKLWRASGRVFFLPKNTLYQGPLQLNRLSLLQLTGKPCFTGAFTTHTPVSNAKWRPSTSRVKAYRLTTSVACAPFPKRRFTATCTRTATAASKTQRGPLLNPDLYPAAPIRLATMLYARTIALRRDGANLGDGTLAIRTSSHTSDLPTRILKERPTSRWCGAASCLCVRNGMVKFSPKAGRPWRHPRFLGARSHIMPIGTFGPQKRSRNG